MKAYYAHCKLIYSKPQEDRDILVLKQLGFDAVNPSAPEYTERWNTLGMDAKDLFAQECDLIAFRATPGGKIPAGVFKEIQAFQKLGKPVIELPSSILSREMTVEETREFLRETGER